MRGFLRTLGAGLSGLIAVLGALAWMLNAFSSIAGDPPAGIDLGPAGDRPGYAPEPAPEPAADGRARLRWPRAGRRVPGGAALLAWARRRRRLAIVLAVTAVFGIGVGLYAFFTAGATAGSGGQAQAGTLDPGNTPDTPSLSGRDATVAWAQNSPTFLGGLLGNDPNGGYLITRYAENDLGTPITPGAACSGLQQGSGAPLTCTETGLPTGRWKYTATPKYYNWLGAESSKSASVTVAPANPTSVSLVNGGGAGNAFINTTNTGSLSFDVVLPATSLSTDTITLKLTDPGLAHMVTVTMSGTAGAGTVSFTAVNGSSLDDGTITITAKATSQSPYNDDSAGTASLTRTKDTVGPTNALSLQAQTGASSLLSGTTLFYRGVGAGAGSFKIRNTLTDSGSGPASSTTSALGGTTTGWSHTPSTVTSGPPYVSNSFSWTDPTTSSPTETVTGADAAGNTTDAPTLTFTNDSAAPTGGALTVNGQTATGGGTTGYNNTGSFSISRTEYTDAGSGLASSTLTREVAALTSTGLPDGGCGSFGSLTTIADSPIQNAGAGIASGNCYRYTLTGTDNLGNTVSIVTIVKVDTSPPSAPAPTLTSATGNTFVSGTTAFINPQAGKLGSFQVADAPTDTQSGIEKVNFPSLTGFTSGGGDDTTSLYSTTYNWSGAAATASGSQTVTTYNNAALTNTTFFTVTPDTTGPTVPAPTVTAGYYTTLSVPVSLGTVADPGGSGVNAGSFTVERDVSTLSNGTCTGFSGNWSAVTLSAGNDTTVTSGHCYRYREVASDNVGNSTNSSASNDAKVDNSPATFGSPALTFSASGNFAFYPGSGTTVYYNGATGTSSSFTVNAPNVADPESGVQKVTFPSPAGFTGGGDDTSNPYSATYTWSSSSAAGTQTATAFNNAGTTPNPTSTFSLVRDVTAPTGGGALTVNTTAASGSGTSSTNTSGTFTIGTRTDYTEAQNATQSGLASSTLVRDTAPLNADGTGTCGTFGSPTTIVGSPTQNAGAGITSGNCYRYTLTGTDNVGNSVSITTTVKVDTTAPSAPTLTLSSTGSFAFTSGTTAYYNGTTGTSSSFTVTATTSDAESGIQNVIFPALTSFTGGGTDPSSPYSTTYTWASSTDTGSKTVTATNGLGNTAASTFSLVRDIAAPTGGALTVNSTAASGGGTTSLNNTGSFTIGTRTDYTETQNATQAGLLSSTLVRAEATLNADATATCGTFGSSTTIVGAPTQDAGAGVASGHCYRYTLTGTDNVGNAVSIVTIVKVDTVAPTATNVAMANGGTVGTADQGDTITVTYSESMDASTFCSTWVNDGTNQLQSGNGVVTVTITNNGANDTLTVSSSGCTFHFGSIALSADYVAATRTFSGNGSNASTITWNPTSKQLTIKLGTGSGATNTSIAASTPSYTADTTLKDLAGNTIGAGPYTGTSSRF